jgi:LysM repeat protein
MDTISRENNSMLPIGGIIVGVIALAFGLYSTVTISKVKTQVAQQQEKVDKIDDIASQASAASAKADTVKTTLDSVVKQTQDAFNGVGTTLGTLQAQVVKLEEGQKRPAKGAKGAKGESAESVVAGPGEYVVKAGDTGRRIASANGCTVSELSAVNPGVDWKRLKVGQKIKLPEKKT